MGILHPRFLHQWTPLADTGDVPGSPEELLLLHTVIPVQGLEEDGGRTFLQAALPIGNTVRNKYPEGDWKKTKTNKTNPKTLSQETKRRNHEIMTSTREMAWPPFVPLSAPYPD